ncbi:hypothetical protein JKP88DRAFT_282452 [Tribonema minus]|uniref:Uncharacterized protein n=1 Tax=Tribonema minus TaxID=303371 RepID=A0A835YK95_9STRA|nr:hypothetical protein JKP88DRAFT_282452 [Tribonema minus]
MTVANWRAAQEADSFCDAMMLCLANPAAVPLDKELASLVTKHGEACSMEWAGGVRILCRLATDCFGPIRLSSGSAHSSGDRLINHVAFAHNSHVNVERGCSPFMLVLEREPRVALHSILGLVGGAAEHSSVSTCAILTELKRARVMRDNAALTRAFNLRNAPEHGDLVWVYAKPISWRLRDHHYRYRH